MKVEEGIEIESVNEQYHEYVVPFTLTQKRMNESVMLCYEKEQD